MHPPRACSSSEARAFRARLTGVRFRPAFLLLFTCLWLVPASLVAQPRSSERIVADAEAQLVRGEYSGAEPGFRAVLNGPFEGRARVGLARVMLATGRYDEAIAATSAASSDTAQRTVRGEALFARGRLDEAEETLRAAVRDDAAAYRARVVLGQVLLRRGRLTDARPVLMEVIAAYNDERIATTNAEAMSYVGMAAALLRSPHDANDAFADASRADRRRVETQLAWADLYLAHYDVGHAEECLRDAIDARGSGPRDARVHLLAARVALAQGFRFADARRELDLAEAINPAHPSLHVMRASIALRALEIAGADAEVDRALAVDPTHLEALAMRATIRFLAEDNEGFERAVSATLAVNPRYGELFTIVAEHADWEHRYPDIVRLAERALALDASDARAMSTRGLNLLRLGREEEGLAQLRDAFRRDRFNVRVFNMLNLYDDVIVPHYQWVEGRQLSFRFHEDERAMLETVVVPTLTSAYGDMRQRYRFTPTGPVRIELYASPQHFSVRTDGLPNLGVQGVCFGQVLTALSPRGGAFDWAQVTTHELAHVFHIQLSNHRVPRWFTEGLAEHETVMARPEWRRENDPELFAALQERTLPPIARLNDAFTTASGVEGVLTAYYASSRVVAYIADTFGFAVLPNMLRAWGRGETTEAVIQGVLHLDAATLDANWRAFELARLAPRAAFFVVPNEAMQDVDACRAEAARLSADAGAQARLGGALLAAGQRAFAETQLRVALRLDEHDPLANYLLAQLAIAASEHEHALQHIDAILTSHDGPEVRLLEGQAALAANQLPRARAALERAATLDPTLALARRGLVQVARALHDPVLEEASLAAYVNLEQHDREALAALIAFQMEAHDYAHVLSLGERVRFLDPHSIPLALALAEAAVMQGDRAAALAWTAHALIATASARELADARYWRVRALVLARQMGPARQFARAARTSDPTLGPMLDAALAGLARPSDPASEAPRGAD